MAFKRGQRRRVTFTLAAPGARDVCLAGSFNNWNINSHHMKLNGDGLWTKTVIIPPGKYEYKYLVGGEWWHDPKNQDVCYNNHGSLNSIIIVH